MNNAVLRGDKKCPHGHTARRKCDTCDREDDQAEIEQLRGNLSLAEEGLANYQQELQRIRQESLTWSLVCQCDCAACEKLFSMIKHAVPQPAPQTDST